MRVVFWRANDPRDAATMTASTTSTAATVISPVCFVALGANIATQMTYTASIANAWMRRRDTRRLKLLQSPVLWLWSDGRAPSSVFTTPVSATAAGIVAFLSPSPPLVVNLAGGMANAAFASSREAALPRSKRRRKCRVEDVQRETRSTQARTISRDKNNQAVDTG